MYRISIVTVTYNCVDVVEETLRSVSEQDYVNLEYVVIDGASKDGTIETINKFRDKIDTLVSEPDHGIFDAMNKSLQYVHGNYVLFMNAGDKFVNNHVVSDIFNSYTGDADLIYGDMYVQNDMGYLLRCGCDIYSQTHSIRDLVFKSQGFSHQSLFTKVDMLLNVKFDTRFKLGADYHTTWRIYQEGNHKILNVHRPICIFDNRNGGASHNRESAKKVLKERLEMFNYQLTWKDKIKVKLSLYFDEVKLWAFDTFPNLTRKYRNAKRNYIKEIK